MWAWVPEPVSVDGVVVQRGRLDVTVDEEGVTRVPERFLVSAPHAGELARISLHSGDRVHAGEALASLEPLPSPLLDARTRSESTARVAAVRAAAARAAVVRGQVRRALLLGEREAERQRVLAARGAAPMRAVEQAETERDVQRSALRAAGLSVLAARHELAIAEAAARGGEGAPRLPPVAVRAPIVGVVLQVFVQSEGPVGLGTPLMELGALESLEAVFEVLTADAVRVVRGAPVRLEGWGGGSVLEGQVNRVEPSAFRRSSALGVDEQRVRVVVSFEGPRAGDGSLGDGCRVEAQIRVARIEGALLVPLGTLFRSGRGWGAYVVREGKARLVAVDVGALGRVQAEVRSGLSEGDVVVVNPGDRLADGVAVSMPALRRPSGRTRHEGLRGARQASRR